MVSVLRNVTVVIWCSDGDWWTLEDVNGAPRTGMSSAQDAMDKFFVTSKKDVPDGATQVASVVAAASEPRVRAWTPGAVSELGWRG